MDSVFVATSNPPTSLSDREMVLSPPSFLDEIRACLPKKGSSATLGPNYLRAIAEEIGRRYDKFFNPYRNVVPHDFVGRICNSDEEIASVVHEMFQARYPLIYERYYETKLRSRPFNVKVIYFLGDMGHAVVFNRLGIRKIHIEDAPNYIGVVTPRPIQEDASTEDRYSLNTPVEVASISEVINNQPKNADSDHSSVLEELVKTAGESSKVDVMPEPTAKVERVRHNRTAHRPSNIAKDAPKNNTSIK